MCGREELFPGFNKKSEEMFQQWYEERLAAVQRQQEVVAWWQRASLGAGEPKTSPTTVNGSGESARDS